MGPGEDRTVLVIDDDHAVRATLQLALELEGYVALAAQNGKDALGKIREENLLPSFILCDLMMPEMNGWQFIEELKKDSALAQIPVAVITAFSDQPKPPHACALLQKPIEIETLYDLVKAHCR